MSRKSSKRRVPDNVAALYRLFPAIVLGIFSKRVGTVPATSGMIAGIGFTGFYIIACVYGGMTPWTFGMFERGISPQGIGALGALLNFAVTLALTPFCAAPSAAARDMVDQVREPEMVDTADRVPGL